MSSQNPGCLAFLFGVGRKQQGHDQFPYQAKQYFFSNAEASFYHFLNNMVGENHIIFPHVALRDLIAVTGVAKSSYYQYYNKIDRKQVDFLLVDSKNLKPVLVIELDDSSHQRADRAERDGYVEKALAAAGIPIARIPVKHSYDAKEISEMFSRAIQGNQSKNI
jgi:very-short-patch-repair endonuclease